MSETIVTIVAIEGPASRDPTDVFGLWDVSLQIIQTDMTFEEASRSLRDRRRYKLIEVFDKDTL